MFHSYKFHITLTLSFTGMYIKGVINFSFSSDKIIIFSLCILNTFLCQLPPVITYFPGKCTACGALSREITKTHTFGYSSPATR